MDHVAVAVVRDAAMDVRAAQLAQDRLIDDAHNLIAAMSRTPLTAEQRVLIAAAGRALREFADLNTCTGEQAQIIAGLADQLTPELEKWSARKVIQRTRDPLATLINPIIGGQPRRNAECRVLYVIQAAPPEMVGSHELPNTTVAHELGPNKAKALWDLVAEHGARS